MTINPHIIEALGRERMADLQREAAAYRLAAKRRREAARERALPAPEHPGKTRPAFGHAGPEER